MKKLLAISALALILSGPAMAGEEGQHEPGKMFEKVDTDKDGLISKAEFLAKHEEMFTKIDTNTDGSLSKEELDAGREKWKAMRKEHEAKGDAPVAPPAEAPAAEAPVEAPAE